MKILVIGGGGKEHALIWKLSRSRHVTKMYCSPGNAGISGIAECIDVSPHNVDALVDFVKFEWIDLTIVCSETVLAQGIADTFERNSCKVFGLSSQALPLLSSRVFAKSFMKRHRIPTAEFQIFPSYLLAQDYVQLKGLPLVIKTNGYPGDKGVFLVSTVEEAADTLRRLMKEKIFGDSGSRIIIEKQMKGERISLVTIADERAIVPLACVFKYRRMTDHDTDSHEAVFGACSPVPSVTKEVEDDIMEKVMYPVHKALNAEGVPYRGFISADIVMHGNSMHLLELHFGFGDLDPQTIMPGLKSDIGEFILSASEGKLSNLQITADVKMSVCVVLFSKQELSDGSPVLKMEGLDAIKKMEDVCLFHENTSFDDRDIVTAGGTALYITASGADLKEAATRAYSAAENIHFEGMQYRKDIGNDILIGRGNI